MIKVSMYFPEPNTLAYCSFRDVTTSLTNVENMAAIYGPDKEATLNVVHMDSDFLMCYKNKKPILVLTSTPFNFMTFAQKRALGELLGSGKVIAVWGYDDIEKSTQNFINFFNNGRLEDIEFLEMSGRLPFYKRFKGRILQNSKKLKVGIKVDESFEPNLVRTVEKLTDQKSDLETKNETISYTPFVYEKDQFYHIVISGEPCYTESLPLIYAANGTFIRFPMQRFEKPLVLDSRSIMPMSAVSEINRTMPASETDIKIIDDLIKESISSYLSLKDFDLLGTISAVPNPEATRSDTLMEYVFHFIMRRELV